MTADSGLLPGAPDPWESSRVPEVRAQPPFLMTEMIAVEPALVTRLIARLDHADGPAAALGRAVSDVASRGETIVATGCGTSEHGAMAFAEIIRDALESTGRPAHVRSAQAFEAALEPLRAGLVVGISHEGGTRMTNAALERARREGIRTGLVTVSDRSPGAALADFVVTTDEQDQSWCHTVGYLSPIVASAAVAAHVTRRPLDPAGAAAVLAAGSADTHAVEAVAGRLAGCRHILVAGSGADRIAGRELALKIEEGTHVPATYRDLETVLHGHLAATDAATGLVLILVDPRQRTLRVGRARGLLAAARTIGMPAAAILAGGASAELADDLTPAGRIVVADPAADDASLSAPVAALLASTTALQLLTERLARALGVNPDAIRRDDDRYRDAADAAEA